MTKKYLEYKKYIPPDYLAVSYLYLVLANLKGQLQGRILPLKQPTQGFFSSVTLIHPATIAKNNSSQFSTYN